MVELTRTTLRHPDGRELYVYGPVRGELPSDDGRPDPPRLHQRRDPLTGEWVAISPARNTRPQTGVTHGCPLCPGGPEVPFHYDAAVFENRFPSLLGDPPQPPPGTGLRATAPSRGRCEVVLYTSAHAGSMATLAPAEVSRVVAVWRDRSLDLWADPRHAFVLVFENRGEEVGATLSHPHGQIYAFDRLPPHIATRCAALEGHRAREGTCLCCDLVATEECAASRVVAGNGAFLVSVPFAPRWPFEVHVRARRHGLRRLGDLTTDEQLELARALADVVARYDARFDRPMPYLMVAMEAPAGAEDWHLAFEFLPPTRSASALKVRASVETATGTFINDTVPENSACALSQLLPEPPRWGPEQLVTVAGTPTGTAPNPPRSRQVR